ncbi:MAG: mitochondrial chaperone [Patescibacteria group bacterium]|nr:mitochondrial chaperone [Patescibacteria group bacterium]
MSKDSQVDAKKRADAVRSALKTVANEDEEVQKAFFLAFYSTLKKYSKIMRVSMSEAENLDVAQMLALTEFSRRKHATFLLKQEIGNRYDAFSQEEKDARLTSGEDRKRYVKNRLRAIHTALSVYPEDLIGSLQETVGMGDPALHFHRAFFTNQASYDTLDELSAEFGLDIPTLIDFAESHPELRFNVAKLRRSIGQTEAEGQQNLASNLLAPLDKPVNAKVASVLDLELREVDSNGFINPNWFLYDISTYLGIKLYGDAKMKYVFGNYFFEAVRQMDEKHGLGLQFPDFYNLCQFRLQKSGPNGKPSTTGDGKPELVDIAHHVFEWVVPADFGFAKLKELASTLRSAVPDLLAVSSRPKEFRHPVKTSAGRQSYVGFFSDAKDFENTNLLLLKPSERDGEYRVRISTDLPQDQFLFLLAQTSRFIGHGDFLDPKQLWTLIYRAYNRLSTENVTTFDISVFEKQYREFLKQIVWPLSREYHEEHGKPGRARHTVLVGLYGTGKSQFLLNLISKKEFAIGDQKLHLNANTVNMGIMDLVDILSKNASDFKKRLSDIHENTKLPIILIIEDIETIINEEGGKSDVVTQALTNFFEGVGSIPVTVVTTTNYPERLSERLIRPNRIDSIIRFDVPLPEELLSHALESHLDCNGLVPVLEKAGIKKGAVLQEFVPRMTDFTTSHVGAFAQAIRHDFDFESKFDPDFRLTAERLDEIFSGILISVDDIQARQKTIAEWHAKLLDGAGKVKMGFTSQSSKR